MFVYYIYWRAGQSTGRIKKNNRNSEQSLFDNHSDNLPRNFCEILINFWEIHKFFKISQDLLNAIKAPVESTRVDLAN